MRSWPFSCEAAHNKFINYYYYYYYYHPAFLGWFVFLFLFSRFQELFLLELISCLVDLPKGWTNEVYFSVKLCGKFANYQNIFLKKHGHLVNKCLKYAEPIINVIQKYAVSVFGRFSTRYFGICHFFLRYCGIGYLPMSPSTTDQCLMK